MKIVNACDGKLQSIPFALGEKGRGRWEEQIQISNREGQAPSGPEDVGFFLIEGKDRKHAILTKPRAGQTGCLVRINTAGTYTRGADEGTVRLVAGEAELLTFGNFADGDMGKLGQQSDELWHAKSPAVFGVILSGGSGKGYGHRYVVITRAFEARMMTRDQLCQLIATDEEPDVVEVVRMYSDKLHADVQAALTVADQLEAAAGDQVEAGTGELIHFVPEYPGSVEAAFEQFGVAIPAQLKGRFETGIGGVNAGTLMPGDRAVVHLKMDSGGGSRYRGEVVEIKGISPLVGDLPEVGRCLGKSHSPYDAGRGCFVALVDDPDWCIAWRQWKDGEPYRLRLADAGGVHTAWVGGRVQTDAWVGREAVTPSPEEVTSHFPEW